jgi:cytochrome c oxidase cbb3-type subunit I
MLVVSVAFYGMATFEGPLMSGQGRQLAQPLYRLDHQPRAFRRALGWVGFVSFGAIYCLVPWLWERKQLVVAIGGIVEITPLFYLKRWGG